MATTPSSLTKSTIIQNVFQNIYDRLKDNISSVNITGDVDVTIQTWTNSFPDKSLDEKGDFPILVINSPDINWEKLTFRKNQVNGTITIDIYTTQSESADKFLDAIIDSIETYRDDLKTVRMTNIILDSTDRDSAFRGAFKVHVASATFSFKYIFTETAVGS